jgi:hypothetical protein
LFFVSSSFISGLMLPLPLLLANVDTLRWATVAIPNPTRHYGWSTLEQDWKPTGRLTYYTIAWPNGRAVCNKKKKKGKKKMMFPSAIFSFPLDGGIVVSDNVVKSGKNPYFLLFVFSTIEKGQLVFSFEWNSPFSTIVQRKIHTEIVQDTRNCRNVCARSVVGATELAPNSISARIMSTNQSWPSLDSISRPCRLRVSIMETKGAKKKRK